MRRTAAIGVLVSAAVMLWSCRQEAPKGAPAPTSAPTSQATAASGEEEDVLGANAGCYVCHMTFVNEELATTHLTAKVACVKCHGTSAAHANDENIGATKPDIVFGHEGINPSCRKCHMKHDAPPEKVLARWQERSRSAYTATQPALGPVCTDCHGEHRIAVVGATTERSSK
jgi:hypothetical protein